MLPLPLSLPSVLWDRAQGHHLPPRGNCKDFARKGCRKLCTGKEELNQLDSKARSRTCREPAHGAGSCGRETRRRHCTCARHAQCRRCVSPAGKRATRRAACSTERSSASSSDHSYKQILKLQTGCRARSVHALRQRHRWDDGIAEYNGCDESCMGSTDIGLASSALGAPSSRVRQMLAAAADLAARSAPWRMQALQ